MARRSAESRLPCARRASCLVVLLLGGTRCSYALRLAARGVTFRLSRRSAGGHQLRAAPGASRPAQLARRGDPAGEALAAAESRDDVSQGCRERVEVEESRACHEGSIAFPSIGADQPIENTNQHMLIQRGRRVSCVMVKSPPHRHIVPFRAPRKARLGARLQVAASPDVCAIMRPPYAYLTLPVSHPHPPHHPTQVAFERDFTWRPWRPPWRR